MLHNTFTYDANSNIKKLTRADPAVNIFDNFTLNKCKLRMQNRLQYNINYSLNATEHLGNVLATVYDVKIQNSSGGVTLDFYFADILSSQDYYAFGMLMPGRNFSSHSYRYSFNGAERDDEIKGAGNSLDFGERMQDPRLGRFLSLDRFAHKFPSQSGYVFASNTPIAAIDKNGDSTYVVIYGSGWYKPSYKGKTYDVGDAFMKSAQAKKAEIESRAGFDPSRDAVILVYAPAEKAYIDALNATYTSGKIAEVVSYSHGTNNSINLGGELGSDDALQDERWLSVYDVSDNTTDPMQREFNQIDKTNFEDNCRVTLYGCNLGGTGTADADNSPAQEFANVLGGNATSNALQGGGGAEFKQKNGKNVYDGQMIRSADRKSQKQKLTEFKPKSP